MSMAKQIFYSNLRRRNGEMPDEVKRLVEMAGGTVDRENQNVYYDALDATRLVHLVVEQCCQMMLDLETKYPANLTVREIRQHFSIDD